VVKVVRSSKQGRRRRLGSGIWHILYIKQHFFIKSRRAQTGAGAEPPAPPLTLTTG